MNHEEFVRDTDRNISLPPPLLTTVIPPPHCLPTLSIGPFSHLIITHIPSSPLCIAFYMEGPLDDSGPLQAADNERVRLGPLRFHQLAFWDERGDREEGSSVTNVLMPQSIVFTSVVSFTKCEL